MKAGQAVVLVLDSAALVSAGLDLSAALDRALELLLRVALGGLDKVDVDPGDLDLKELDCAINLLLRRLNRGLISLLKDLYTDLA